MRAVEIRTIEHRHQRYNRVGDWIQSYGMPTRIIISHLPHPDYEFVTAMRELVNMYLTTQQGLAEKNPVDRSEALLIEDLLIKLLNIDESVYRTAMEDVCKT